jgi:hypothetical protein
MASPLAHALELFISESKTTYMATPYNDDKTQLTEMPAATTSLPRRD